MVRPALTHDGFLIPNAADVTNPRMAEPDRIDFNTVAHAQWGVIDGCLVTVTGTTANVTAGTAIVNGLLVTVGAQTQVLGSSDAQDRFDLLALDQAGTLQVVPGAQGVDPVFPDVPLNMTVLAAVFAPAGATADYSSNVIDKRKFLPKALLTKVAVSALLVQNRNGTGDQFSILGDGTIAWNGDTWLSRSSPGVLSVQANLAVSGSVTSGNIVAHGSVAADSTVTGVNLLTGNTLPVSGANGALFQNSANGRVYVWRNSAWQELVTFGSAIPVGTILQSLEIPANMVPQGWVPLNGNTITEAQYPSLFALSSLSSFITGTAPNRSMQLPDATNRVLLGGTTAGVVGGSSQVMLAPANLPSHTHQVAVQSGGGGPLAASIGRGGIHAHGVTGGTHAHAINDKTHAHNGMDLNGSAMPVIALLWGGQNKIDAMFNDRNHTYSVEKYYWTSPASTGITGTTSAGSDHTHNVSSDGDHGHALSISDAPIHAHAVSEQPVGANAPVSIIPPYMTVFTYVRS